MTTNVRQEMITIPDVENPNYKGIGSSIQRIYPQSNIISGTAIAGDLNFMFSVPSGMRLDTSACQIMFEYSNVVAAGTVLVNSVPAVNQPATFFSNGRFSINGNTLSTSHHIAQDDSCFKRMTQSLTKLRNTSPQLWGSVTERAAAWATKLRQKIGWLPQCLISPDMVITENAQCHLNLSVAPNLMNPLTTPASVVRNLIAPPDLTLRFHEIYMIAKFVKIDVPVPKQVYLPAYNIASYYQSVTGLANANLQFQIPKDTYKIVVALQSSAATVLLGQVLTVFSSGDTPGAGPVLTQNAQSQLLTNLQVRYAGNTYPNTPYNIAESATQSTSADAYLDWLTSTDAMLDPSGGASYADWSDPTIATDTGLGRLFAFPIIKPTNDQDTTCEVSVSFSAAPATTNVWLLCFSKQAWLIEYGTNNTISETRAVNFSDLYYNKV
jgi:hypothetical protein